MAGLTIYRYSIKFSDSVVQCSVTPIVNKSENNRNLCSRQEMQHKVYLDNLLNGFKSGIILLSEITIQTQL